MSTFSLHVLVLLLLSPFVSPFNITKILSPFPDLSTFNNLLTQTHLASEINLRQTITILAVPNSAAASLSSDPAAKKILSLHVILDYYDEDKLRKFPQKTATLTTLFQASGGAVAGQGFLNVSRVAGGGGIAFGSAVKGSQPVAKLVKSVFSEPYNVSVLEVSTAIVPLGLDNTAAPAPEPMRKEKPAVPSPAPENKNKKKKEIVAAPSPTPEDKKKAADAPENSGPVGDRVASDESDAGKLFITLYAVAIVGIFVVGVVL